MSLGSLTLQHSKRINTATTGCILTLGTLDGCASLCSVAFLYILAALPRATVGVFHQYPRYFIIIIKAMAEVFGTVASALSVAALFNNCVDCFEYVQIGRRFGQDYERCQLKIDIAKIRLSRWGEAVAINKDARFATARPPEIVTQKVEFVLEQIGLLFQSVQKTSKGYELDAKQEDLLLFYDEDMRPDYQRPHRRLKAMVLQRQQQTSLMKKVAWALYDAKHFDRLVEQIMGFIDDLEKICPVEAARRQLAQLEIEDISDEPSLRAVSDAAAQIDPLFAEAAAQKLEGIATKIQVGKATAAGKARMRIGNQYTENVARYGVRINDQTSTSVDTADAKEQAIVQIGNSYGSSIFDS